MISKSVQFSENQVGLITLYVVHICTYVLAVLRRQATIRFYVMDGTNFKIGYKITKNLRFLQEKSAILCSFVPKR